MFKTSDPVLQDLSLVFLFRNLTVKQSYLGLSQVQFSLEQLKFQSFRSSADSILFGSLA